MFFAAIIRTKINCLFRTNTESLEVTDDVRGLVVAESVGAVDVTAPICLFTLNRSEQVGSGGGDQGRLQQSQTSSG